MTEKELAKYGLAGTEHDDQVSLFQWWRLTQGQKPWAELMFAIPNGGARSKASGVRLKAEGVKAGVPDIFLAWPRGGKAGLWIELKRFDGRLSQAQKLMLAELEKAGYATTVAVGWPEAKERIEEYLRED